MSLSVTNVGNNPQVPGIFAETYVPDQLIAGSLKLVTDTVLITGGAALKRGSALGAVALGSISSSTGTAFATGSIIVASLPTAGDTVTIGGTVVTFVAVNPVGNQVAIGATTAATAAALAALLIGSTDVNLVKFSYSVAGSTVTTTAVAAGTGGNALTLATNDATAFTVSGATLTGGVANTGNATVGSIAAGAKMKAGNYSAVCLTATTANVFDPSGNEIGQLVFGTTFVDAQISFRVTAGGTPCVAGDAFYLNASVGSGSYKLSIASAIDGSANPTVILVDDVDASAGDVMGSIYRMGEFNASAVIFGAGITLAGAKASLENKNIYLKGSVSAADPS